MGKIVKVDMLDGEVIWGEYMSIRVRLDVSKPLLRREKIKIGENEVVWIQFSNERLLDFCYCCAIMGHGHRDCVMWKEFQEKIQREGLPHGKWLRAYQPKSKGGRFKQQQQPMDSDAPLAASPTNTRAQIPVLEYMEKSFGS